MHAMLNFELKPGADMVTLKQKITFALFLNLLFISYAFWYMKTILH